MVLTEKVEGMLKVGWKPTKATNPDFKCRKCGSNEILFTESDDYEDYHYHCTHCGNDWWVEGSDY